MKLTTVIETGNHGATPVSGTHFVPEGLRVFSSKWGLSAFDPDAVIVARHHPKQTATIKNPLWGTFVGIAGLTGQLHQVIGRENMTGSGLQDPLSRGLYYFAPHVEAHPTDFSPLLFSNVVSGRKEDSGLKIESGREDVAYLAVYRAGVNGVGGAEGLKRRIQTFLENGDAFPYNEPRTLRPEWEVQDLFPLPVGMMPNVMSLWQKMFVFQYSPRQLEDAFEEDAVNKGIVPRERPRTEVEDFTPHN